ncbi:MAG: glucuronate isomerase [Rhodospirillaceae bacterium]|jgi:glucuronate isomerase|nr:glucuronate isomerase [Rhodospirillaceae bacterium]
MTIPLTLNPDRLFPSDSATREISRTLYQKISNMPILSPHGHTDPKWFAENQPFPDPSSLFIIPDHYVLRMLYSSGLKLEELGVSRIDGSTIETDKRKIWRLFAENFYLFRGTPSGMWLNHAFHEVFNINERLNATNADKIYDQISTCLERPEFYPRALYEKFNIEVLATTESPLDDLRYHKKIKNDQWKGRVITSYRPDPVVDPNFPNFLENLIELGKITNKDTKSWNEYLEALFVRRRYFIENGGCTSTDHGHPTAFTANLSKSDAETLFSRVSTGIASIEDAELFRGQMLTEMARMSLEDGLTMQIHPGAFRNYNPTIFKIFGQDKGCDIPKQTDYVYALKPLLDRFGNENKLTIILFTLDETSYSRELAPLAGHFPALRLGPSWWFHDSPEGMLRYRKQVTETAGFYNTIGFIDDTRALPSIPARHDVSRRIDCGYLGRLVAEHRLDMDEALEIANDLAYRLTKKAFNL